MGGIPTVHSCKARACVVRMGAPHDDTFALCEVERETMCYKQLVWESWVRAMVHFIVALVHHLIMFS